ncbi:YdcF family protein [Aliiroseovarius sp. 2305UL8-7]|uniref:YdcF family protein n=1 Tax=Aliiroseovarius conchicola TaxID=3121637 RepID=UPI003526EA9A
MTRIAIVLGAAVRPDGTASPALRRRSETAAKLFLESHVDRIIASGGVPRAGKSEAELIAEICVQAGVPSSAVIEENKSGTTFENIKNCIDMLPQDAQVTLVTDRYHSFRARMVAREFGLFTNSVSPEIGSQSVYRIIQAYVHEAAALVHHLLQRIKRINSRRSR